MEVTPNYVLSRDLVGVNVLLPTLVEVYKQARRYVLDNGIHLTVIKRFSLRTKPVPNVHILWDFTPLDKVKCRYSKSKNTISLCLFICLVLLVQ